VAQILVTPTVAKKKDAEVMTVNRRLIRPNLTEIKDQLGAKPARRRPVPPEQTNAEAFYYLKQMNNKTPMVVVLSDGEEIRGVIEWYDRNCLKVNRTDKPNLLVMKHTVKYMYKENEGEAEEREEEE
jgi:host factor-I protein